MKQEYLVQALEVLEEEAQKNGTAKINILFGDIQNKIRELNEAFAAIGNAELEGKVKGVLSEQLKG